jgi:hypothetical protein
MGKLLRIRALSETLTPTAPAWSAMPSPTIIEGQSGSYTLPVANATSVTWAGSVAQPAWLTLVAANPPRLTWSTAPAAATIDATCELIAVGAGGSVPSGKFALTVVAATGFFTGYTVTERPLTTVQGNNDNGIQRSTKQTVWSEHPSGRIWGPFGGDYPNNFDMWQWSLNPTTWAPGTTNQPTGWKLEQAHPVGLGYPYISRTDCQQIAWDSKRKLWWHVGGYVENVPVDAYAFRRQVAKFDPSQPINQRWSTTGVPYQSDSLGRLASEQGGPAVYDPLTDCVYAHHGWNAPRGNICIWNCATQAWLGWFRCNDIFEIDDGAYTVQVVGIDPVRRLLYIRSTRNVQADFASPVTQQFRRLYKIALPSSVASLPAAGTSANMSASCVEVWNNAGRTTTLISIGGDAFIRRDNRNLYLAWLKGPNSTIFESGEPSTKYGSSGHPNKGNGTYGSANTGILVDLDTGAEEYTQLPHPTYEDGQGWVVPNIVIWSQKYSALVYMTKDAEYGNGLDLKIESNAFIVREAPPDWLAPLSLYQWYPLPNSTCETQLTAAVRTAWSGPEASGGSACELNFDKCPWNYSGMALRRRGSYVLFHGGGGGDGRGNGVLGFKLNANLSDPDYGWCLPMKPTPFSKTVTMYVPGQFVTENSKEFSSYSVSSSVVVESSPRSPVAVHAYRSATFLDSEDKWLRFGTQMVHPTDAGYFTGVHGFQWSDAGLTEADWIINAKTAFPFTVGEAPGGRTIVKDPWSEDMLCGADSRWHYFNRAAGTWTSNVQASATDYKVCQAFDPATKVAIFELNGGIPAGLDFSNGHPRTVLTGNASSWGGPNGAEYQGSDAAWTWDDENACWWALKVRQSIGDGSFKLFKIVLTSKATMQFSVTRIDPDTTLASPSLTNINTGIGNRFQWVAELGGIVLSTGYRDPIHFIKTSTKG